MPHFGLMDEQKLGHVEGPLLRARLHIRSGRRRLRAGETALAVAILADALDAAFRWYLALPGHRARLAFRAEENPRDACAIHGALVQAGVLDGAFDCAAFERDLDRALEGDPAGIDGEAIMTGMEGVMRQLGVMPFDEAALPPEVPGPQ